MEEVQKQLGELVMAVLQGQWLDAKLIAMEVRIEFRNGVPMVAIPPKKKAKKQ